MPTLRALQCFVAVCDHESFTRAAAALGISQPALSHQLASLQEDVGIDLVGRRAGGMRPTAAGRALLAPARAAIDAERSFSAQARRVAGLQEGELHICCAQSLTAGLMPPVLRRWSHRRRDVSISLTEYARADQVAAALTSGGGDVGICPRPSAWRGPLTVLGREQIVAAMSSGNPLAQQPTVTLADLAVGPFIQYNAGHGLARWVETTFAAAGLSPQVAVRTGQTSATAALAASGVGTALVPLSAVPARYPGALRQLTPELSRELVVLHIGTPEPLVDAFIHDLTVLGIPRLRSDRRV